MNLKQISNSELILRIEKLARTERKITHLILLHISEIESRKLYAELGYDGMYSFLTRGLGYSEGSAYRRLQSARLLKQVPAVAEKLAAGSLNLTQLSQVQKCLKEASKVGEASSPERTLELLNKIENKNSWETQKTLALEMEIPVVLHDKVQPQKDDSVRLELTLTQEQFQILEQAKNLLSHRCPEGSWAEVIATLAKDFQRKKLQGRSQVKEAELDSQFKANPNSASVDSATRAQSVDLPLESELEVKLKAKVESEPTNEQEFATGLKINSIKTRRTYISIHHRRFLLAKAQHQCEYENPKTGRRCSSRYQLEIDHCHPLAFGGSNEISNLRILCRTHNLLAAEHAGLGRKD